jgi:hypothetical protein
VYDTPVFLANKNLFSISLYRVNQEAWKLALAAFRRKTAQLAGSQECLTPLRYPQGFRTKSKCHKPYVLSA